MAKVSFCLLRATATAPMWATCITAATIGLSLSTIAAAHTTSSSACASRTCTTATVTASNPCVLSRIKFRKKCFCIFSEIWRHHNLPYFVRSFALAKSSRKFSEKKPHVRFFAFYFFCRINFWCFFCSKPFEKSCWRRRVYLLFGGIITFWL